MGKRRTPNPKNGSGVFLDHLHHDLLPETFRDPSRMSVRFFCISLCWGWAWLRHPFPPNCHFPSGRPSGKPSGSFREPSGTAVFCNIVFFHICPRKNNFDDSSVSSSGISKNLKNAINENEELIEKQKELDTELIRLKTKAATSQSQYESMKKENSRLTDTVQKVRTSNRKYSQKIPTPPKGVFEHGFTRL